MILKTFKSGITGSASVRESESQHGTVRVLSGLRGLAHGLPAFPDEQAHQPHGARNHVGSD